jgi:hypothetical protein
MAGGCASEPGASAEVERSLRGPVCAYATVTAELRLADLQGPSPACLSRSLPRGEDGTVDCSLLIELPAENGTGAGQATSCDDVAHTRDAGSDGEHIRCALEQVAVLDDQLAPAPAAGWYYDDFSSAVLDHCEAGAAQRIALTDGVRVPDASVVLLQCATVLGTDGALSAQDVAHHAELCAPPPSGGSASGVGDACTPGVAPAGGFDELQAYVEVGSGECQTGACLVYQLRGDTRPDCDATHSDCASPGDVADRVYCSCRCSAAAGVSDAELCDCPSGYSCIDALAAPEALAGGYCVRNGAATR